MQCKDPRHKRRTDGNPGFWEFPCGQCMPCRINKHVEWRNRMMMEHFVHTSSAFITLTYDEIHHPRDGCLSKRDVQLFLKRYRKALAKQGRKLRYFLVGEYGPQTYRPHYHMVHFGGQLTDGEILDTAWSQGFTSLSEFNHKRANYIAGYCLKKWTSVDRIPDHLSLTPEFAFMSKRPGLGSGFAEVVARGYARVAAKLEQPGAVYEPGSIAHLLRQNLGSEMYTFRQEGKKYGMTKFVRNIVRKELEWDGLSDLDKEILSESTRPKRRNNEQLEEKYARKAKRVSRSGL